MKAKYSHYGNDCMVYDLVFCVENVVGIVTSYQSTWFNLNPQHQTTVCLTNAEARRKFFQICYNLETQKYRCLYKEVD